MVEKSEAVVRPTKIDEVGNGRETGEDGRGLKQSQDWRNPEDWRRS